MRTVTTLLFALVLVAGCNLKNSAESVGAPAALNIPKVARCAGGDQPETGLQGQVPAALRAVGFKGFNCNLRLIGQYVGEGGGWSSAAFEDRAGHRCAYYATGYIKDFNGNPIQRLHPGVAVIDVSEPARPMRTTSLTTAAMMDPWESLRVNPRRQVLAGDFGANSIAGGDQLDFYDLSGDCRQPQLLASVSIGVGANGGMRLPKAPIGHEGSFSPDGLTYYVGDIVNKTYTAVDILNMTKPKVIAQFDMATAPFAGPGYTGTAHGLSISDDGNRAYLTSVGFPSQADIANPNYKNPNGFYVVDTTEVQARQASARIKLISATRVKDGSLAQAVIPIRVGRKPYLVFVDEGGSVGTDATFPTAASYTSDVQASCRAGLAPFPMARLFDITDERHPKEVSKLMLETHDPANCNKVLSDLAGLALFSYGSHYCSVDNRQNATALACSYFNSGVRVFDIREPSHPKEIAYFNPPGTRIKQPGSGHVIIHQWQPGGPDWCTSRLDFDYTRRMLMTACTDNGLLVMQFENGVWPMPESTLAIEQNH